MEQTLKMTEEFQKFVEEQTKRVNSAIHSELYGLTYLQMIKSLNRAVMDLAEQSGLSVYDICFNYYPVFDYEVEEGVIKCSITFKRIEPCQAEAKE